MNEIDVINERLRGDVSNIPCLLYKYRPFDQYALDMLENNYLYLCPAKNLDDPSECTVSFDLKDYYDLVNDNLKFLCVDQILNIIKPYTTEDNYRNVRDAVISCLNFDGSVKRNWLLEASFEMQNHVSREDSVTLVNWIGNIPDKLDEPEIKNQIEKLLFAAYDAREDMGICSLSELDDSEEMWQNYADNCSGYCIEYDITNYEHGNFIFPVVYQNARQNNIIITIVSDFISQMIFGISNGQLNPDRSNYIRMFLTKNEIWNYQKEWRLLGDANTKMKAPQIKSVILGKNMARDNKNKLITYCKEHNIHIIEK